VLTLKKVAVTGGLASGKTSVCRFLGSFGAYVVNADEIVHQLLSPKTLVGQQIITLLGQEIISNQGLDRAKIAKIVFSHPKKLQLLEQILHPAVLDEIENQFLTITTKEFLPTLFVAEIPLLFEIEQERYFDSVIAVVADRDTCRKRFSQATLYTDLEFDQRMQRQWQPEEKAACADYTIINNGSMEELKEKVKLIYIQLI